MSDPSTKLEESEEELDQDSQSTATTQKNSPDSTSGDFDNADDNANEAMDMEEFMLLKQQKDEHTSKILELEEIIKRQQAEFDNYRKRTLKEREDLTKEAGEKILKDVIEVYDNFERALSVETNDHNKSLVEGFKMIEDQMKSLLKTHHISEIEGIGHPFDPNFHQAIQFEEASHIESDEVGEVYQKGFKLGEKVLRHARVKVLKAGQKDIENKDEKKDEAT